MICLGIESTAHTFGAGIIDDKARILANEKSLHSTKEGGLIPRELFEHHVEKAPEIIGNALRKAGVSMKEIDLISFSQGPGIGNALRVGALSARALALKYGKPVIGVNHCIAHIEIGKALTKAKDPVVLYASGANTQVIGFENKKYRIFGETLDIGTGNLLDSFGRKIGLGFPAGPVLDAQYFEGKKLIELPYTVKGMDLAFSGLLTSAEKKIGKENEKDLAYSLLHTAFSMLLEVSERAMAYSGKKELLITGGVASSRALREMAEKMCGERNAEFFVPPKEVCVDNGAMIAWQGMLEFLHGRKMEISETAIKPKQRTDEVEVNWM